MTDAGDKLTVFRLVRNDGVNESRNRIFGGFDVHRQPKCPKSRRSHRPNGSKPDTIELSCEALCCVAQVPPPAACSQQCHKVPGCGGTRKRDHVGTALRMVQY